MGTVAEVLGFEPEVLWMPELDELNSERGRLALAESARAELLAVLAASKKYGICRVSRTDCGHE